MKDFSETWLDLLDRVIHSGTSVAPRGKPTKELSQHTIAVDMRRPVLRVPKRGINYKFMAAEAHWILSGDERVATIAQYNERIAQFSDDGEIFYGAYGPRIIEQLPYVIDKLLADPDTRQAGLTTWRTNPPDTKDVPCTIAIFFLIRNGQLNSHVFMRSSDVWLGVPYDVFNFSMLAHLVAAKYNQRSGDMITPGRLYLTAASSHLYLENEAKAIECLKGGPLPQDHTPEFLFTERYTYLLGRLADLRDVGPGHPLRWWE